MPNRCRSQLLYSTLLASLPILLVGCYSEDPIRSYTVEKVAKVEPASTPVGEEQRMLAAIMLPGEEAWFFKLTGPTAAVAKVEEEVKSLVDSVTFGPDGDPQWKAPAGWERLPASGFRFATLEIPNGEKEPLELSVSSLPQASTDTPAYLLDNVNRWRGQLSQPPLTPATLADAVQQYEVAGVATTWVDITGASQGGGMGGPFMAGNASTPPPAAPISEKPLATQGPEVQPEVGPQPIGPLPAGPQQVGPQPVRPTAPTAGGSDDISFETPAGWTEKAGGGFRKLAFDIQGEGGKGELTVIQLGPRPGSVLDNINRWRGQVKLAPLTEAELGEALAEVPVGDEKGQVAELIGPEQGILGAIVSRPDATWFIKLQADSPLAKAERAKFDAFLKTLKIK